MGGTWLVLLTHSQGVQELMCSSHVFVEFPERGTHSKKERKGERTFLGPVVFVDLSGLPLEDTRTGRGTEIRRQETV